MHAKGIIWFGQKCQLVCDGKCNKAWGINNRPTLQLDPQSVDDFVWLADDELPNAPAGLNTFEGGFTKPASPDYKNKWCARECERSAVIQPGDRRMLDFSKRIYNQPNKHQTEIKQEKI